MNQWCLLIFLEKYHYLLCVLCFTWGSAVYLRVTKHDFNQLFQQIKQIPLASIKQIEKKIQTMFKILLRDYTWTICTICGDHWAKKNTGYNFQLYFKIIVLENDQLYARPVVKSPPEWCHRICLGSLKQFSEEPLVSLFAFSLSVLHSAFLTVSSFFARLFAK